MIEESDFSRREADHRIRNSLQLVAGLLQAQARVGGCPDVASELLAASRRVACIAAVHERLQRDPQAGFVALRPYLEGLCLDLERAFSRRGGVRLTADEVQVLAGQATDLGLITTELVLNALKYAGEGTETIDVVARLETDRFVLAVSDRGIGMPAGLPGAEAEGGLGMKLLRGLAARHDAELAATSDSGGTTVAVSIPRARLAAA